ncbi:MAG: sensor histidine kinase [Zhaonellaceae bacterium]|nr:HAMP domain-containing histidine kinase [Clostridia bacterium]
MATKWKNRLYILVTILLFTFGVSGILSSISLSSKYLEFNYAETSEFNEYLNEFTNLLGLFELNYSSQAEMKAKITVAREEIDEHRYRYGDLPEQIESIKSQYEEKILSAKQMGLQDIAEMYATERDEKIADITKNFTSDDHVRAKIVKEKEEKIEKYFKELEGLRPRYEVLKKEFRYYLTDRLTGQVYKNIAADNEKEAREIISPAKMLAVVSYPHKERGYLRINDDYSELPFINRDERTFAGLIGVPKSGASLIEAGLNEYRQRQVLYGTFVFLSLMALALSIYLYKRRPFTDLPEEEKWQTAYKRVPLDLGLLIFLLTFMFTYDRLAYAYNYYMYRQLDRLIFDFLFGLCVTACFLVATVLQGKLLLDRVNNWDSFAREWQTSIIYRFYQSIKEAFLIRSLATQVLIILMIVFVFGAGAVIALMEMELIFLYFLGCLFVGLPILYAIIRNVGCFNRIVTNTNGIVAGHSEPDLPLKGITPLVVLANNINTLKNGVKVSRQEQAKSERLKTELITNVSHDLRTPLTSIITYIELLHKPNLTADEQQAYIGIIDRKAKRLKVLIDDLFEASKMASGSVELSIQKVDVAQLLEQALAEHGEAISTSPFEFRISKPEQPVYIMADGQKMWRAFDNLINNILKYTLPQTRVYITMEAQEKRVFITFKNIAKYELGQNTDELFERFKRGDDSRHTEGSGLGLAIAKSIVDLHGGSMEIKVDGDLFKIIVKLDTVKP